MRILLTGSRGQVGRHLLARLRERWEVVAWSRAEVDLTDVAAIEAGVRAVGPDVVINAAAYTAVDRAESEPDLCAAVNATAPAALARAAAAVSATMIHYSTDYVFDGTLDRPYRPDDVPNPLGVYGRTKLDGERAVLDSGVSALVLRTSAVYDLEGRNFLQTILGRARAGEPLRVVADQVTCPTYAGDIADATVTMLERAGCRLGESHGLHHVVSRDGASWYDFACAIVTEAGLDATVLVSAIPTSEYPTPARRPAWSVLDGSTTAATFDLVMPPWRDALVDAMRRRPSSLRAA